MLSILILILWWLFILVAVFLVTHIFHLLSWPRQPELFFHDSLFGDAIIREVPLLRKIYNPPWLWGRSGHLHTIIYGFLGRLRSPFPKGKRILCTMDDGATSSFDYYDPLIDHPSGGDYTILVCPGIANSSESLYIRTFVNHAQKKGFRVAVLNHLGCATGVPLTAPRIFNYGDTKEFDDMYKRMHQLYPHTGFILCGFSMGGNVVMKYVGEQPSRQKNFIGLISCCQGYDALQGSVYMTQWAHLRRFYLWTMTRYIRKVLVRHRDFLLCEQVQKKHNTSFDVKSIEWATSLTEVDELYSRRVTGFKDTASFYRWCSCVNYFKSIDMPVFLLNAADDPIVPPPLVEIAKRFATTKNKAILALTRHGGHLGFFEGRHWLPRTLTWLDKVVVQVSNAMIHWHEKAESEL